MLSVYLLQWGNSTIQRLYSCMTQTALKSCINFKTGSTLAFNFTFFVALEINIFL